MKYTFKCHSTERMIYMAEHIQPIQSELEPLKYYHEYKQNELELELWKILVITSHHNAEYSWVWSELRTYGIEPREGSDAWEVHMNFITPRIDHKLSFHYGRLLTKWILNDALVTFKGHVFLITLGADGRMEVEDRGKIPPLSTGEIWTVTTAHFHYYLTYERAMVKATELFQKTESETYEKVGALIMLWWLAEKTKWEEPPVAYFREQRKKACECLGINDEDY